MDRNIVKSQTDQWWYSHQRQIRNATDSAMDGNLLPLKELLTARFEAGARWAMKESTALNPYVSQFVEMLVLLGVFDEKLGVEESEGESSDKSLYPGGGLFDLRDSLPVHSARYRDDANAVQQMQLQGDDRRPETA